MRRREKFVLTSLLLSLGLLATQYVPLEWRYAAVAIFVLVTYVVSAWSLSEDLQRFELFTIVPFPSLYAGAVGAFYFLLPDSWVSRTVLLALFGVGMYSIYLTANIYSVAKGRTIQLLHAAHAVGLLFTLMISLLFTNTLFSHRLPFYWNGLLAALIHAPLVFHALWSIELAPRVTHQLVRYTAALTIIIAQIAIIISLLPLSVWEASLFVMSFLYIALGIVQNALRERLFQRTLTEYSLVAIFLCIALMVLIPWK